MFDGGGGEDDAMSGLIGADKNRAAQSNDKNRAAQSNTRRKSEENFPDSEMGFETGVGTGQETRTGVGIEMEVGLGLDVFDRLANTSTTHIHRSLPSKQQNKSYLLAKSSNRSHPYPRSKQQQQQQQQQPHPAHNVPDESGDDDTGSYGENDFKAGVGVGICDGGTRDGVMGGKDTGGDRGMDEVSHGVRYLASEDEMCMRWMRQHTLLTATERHVAIAASTKVNK